MATDDPLTDLLNSDVDDAAINALVGSLESQLASPPITESAGQNSVNSTVSNHVGGPQVVASVNTNIQQHTSSLTTTPGKAGLLQTTAHFTPNVANGGNNHGSQAHILSVTSNPTSAITQAVNAGAQINSNVSQSLLTSVSSNVTAINSTPLQGGTSGVPKQVIVTVGSTNTGTVVLPSSQNSVTTVPVTLPQAVIPNHTTITNSIQPGSNIQGTSSSGIHSLANVAAAQKPITIPSTIPITSGTNGNAPRIVTVQQHNSKTNSPLTINTTNVPRPQIVMQNKPPDIRMVAHTQPHIIASPAQPQTLNISSAQTPTQVITPASTNANVITIAKPNPQTVTVVRPNATTQPGIAPQQIQIVNVNARPTTATPQPKPLAPRTQTTPIRIAPQQAIVNRPPNAVSMVSRC